MAKDNRRNMTEAEAYLWGYIRAGKLGHRFRRQHPIDDFIVDFLCLPLNFIIEVDGGYHQDPEQKSLDQQRSEYLTSKGYHIIRFTNEEVLQDITHVINMIKTTLNEISSKATPSETASKASPSETARRSTPSETASKASPSLGGGRGRLIIFAAPSGSGKSTIINWLMQEHPELNMHFSISCTSRAPRGTEQDGVEYFFLTPEEFRKKIEADEFVEYEEVYQDRYYGTLKSQVDKQLEQGENVVFDVDVHGAMNIKKAYGDRAMSLFIQPPSIEELRRRLNGRGTDAPEVIEQRIARAEYELSFAPKFDTVVVNDDLQEAKENTLQKIAQFFAISNY